MLIQYIEINPFPQFNIVIVFIYDYSFENPLRHVRSVNV